MAAPASSSLKEYLKKYESNAAEEEKKKKKKKKKSKPVAVAAGVLVVDEDPVWHKPVSFDEEEENDSPDEKPQVDEDIEFKRMKRLEELRARRSYNEISEDGSGWVPVSDAPKSSTTHDLSSDISPPRNRKARFDTPSPEPGMDASDSGREVTDLSPPRQRRQRNDSPSPGPDDFVRESSDLSPPRQRKKNNDFPSSKHVSKSLAAGEEVDLSPPRQRRRRYDSPSPERRTKVTDAKQDSDMSPPRRRGRVHGSLSPMPQKISSATGVRDSGLDDLSPPRRECPASSKLKRVSEDLSPPRKIQKGIDKRGRRANGAQEESIESDLSPPRKSKQQQKTGLITGKDVSTEIEKIKKDEWTRFNEMDPSASGRGAEPVYRYKGERISKDEYLKLTKKKEKPKEEEKKLEWGKGLAQKREAEARLLEMELEKEKPFARSRDDPELDSLMKDRLRWGDPMAHLVKKKQSDLLLSDLGDSEKMKESGFIIPQDIPSHSWIKRGLDYEPNRYGIKPGRHWDGVNRSTGYEKQLFKRTNEKRATEKEAYLWSVSDM
ncbi:BUD13 homolog isoform X1 [Chenopodium quinoa]|uniref:BUD13 homolog isoform X1 n=2 Tax=Chenopodium quinoa TaxID=63459 RepID=UPI000B7946F4|nr:BUD13 homolog isoform X1 [Chenopodium quinoa]